MFTDTIKHKRSMIYYWIKAELAKELNLTSFRRGNDQGYIVMESDLMTISISSAIRKRKCKRMSEQEAIEYIESHNI